MRIVFNKINFIFILLLTAVCCTQMACQKDSSSIPVITGVHLLDSTSRDSLFTETIVGNRIVINGSSFDGLQHVYFNDVDAPFNSALNSSTNIIIVVPADAPTSVTDPTVPNQIKVVTNHGEATFNFTLLLPPPAITSISNENALPGSTITITGTNLYLDKIIFPGNLETTTFTVNDDKTQATVTVPAGISTSGPLTLQGTFGSYTTPYPFDSYLAPATGFLANFEWGDPYFGWQYWGGINTNDANAFPQNTGNYIQVHPSNTINAQDNSWYSDNRAVMVASMPWVSEANLSNPIANYALKFEIFVKTPWTNGSLMIAPNGNLDYLARYAPWENTSGGKFVTTDWTTVTIPLTSFLNGGGTGSPAANIAALTGGGNAAPVQIMLYNNSSAPIESFDAAVDNVRIEKIQ